MATLILRPISDYYTRYCTPNVDMYSYVDEEIHDDDTTYLLLDVDGSYAVFNMVDTIINSGIINFVKVIVWVLVGHNGGQIGLNINSTYYWAAAFGNSASYTERSQQWDTNPDTTIAWTWDDINNLICGVQHQSGKVGLKLTQLYVEVDYTPNESNPITRPFAVNTGDVIPGTTQVYNIAIGSTQQDYSGIGPGGVIWYSGPDENLGYIIAKDNGTQPRFWRTTAKTDVAFIFLVNRIRKVIPGYTTVGDCTTWLASNSYYTDYPV